MTINFITLEDDDALSSIVNRGEGVYFVKHDGWLICAIVYAHNNMLEYCTGSMYRFIEDPDNAAMWRGWRDIERVIDEAIVEPDDGRAEPPTEEVSCIRVSLEDIVRLITAARLNS